MTPMIRALACIFALALSTAPAIAGARAPSTAPTAPNIAVVQAASSSCGMVPEEDYWLCKAVVDRDCGLVASDQYWYCKAFTTRACGLLAHGDDYWFCLGLTRPNCTLVARPQYWLCKGVTEQNCDLVAREDYWRCAILIHALRPDEDS